MADQHLMVDVTEALWEGEGSRTAPGKDVIRRFTYAAVKAAERKDAARCQAQPAGEAAWHTVVWCQPHLGPLRCHAPQGTLRSLGYSTSRSRPSPPPSPPMKVLLEKPSRWSNVLQEACLTGCSVKGSTFKDTKTHLLRVQEQHSSSVRCNATV